MLSKDELESLLRNWLRLNQEVMNLSEEELQQLIGLELSGRARLRVLLRVYNRYSKVRSIREKAELGSQAKG